MALTSVVAMPQAPAARGFERIRRRASFASSVIDSCIQFPAMIRISVIGLSQILLLELSAHPALVQRSGLGRRGLIQREGHMGEAPVRTQV